MIDDLWYKNGVIYCLSVGTYMDANGDGIGDFRGLLRRLDYLHGLGITAIWLMPFQPSPDARRRLRHIGLLRRRSALRHARRLRRVHPWLQAARHPRHHRSRRQPHLRSASLVQGGATSRRISPYRDWYVWSDKKPANAHTGMVFPGVQKSTWSARQGSRRLVFSPLLRFPARSQHVEPARAGGNPENHGVLDPARRLRLPHGRRAVRDRDQRSEGEKAGRAIRHAALVPGIPAMAKGRRHHPRRGQCAARNRHGIFRRATATACT